MRLFLGFCAVLVAAGFAWLVSSPLESEPLFYPKKPLSLLIKEAGKWPDSTPKKYVVHFWASWCAPCLVELPKFKKFSETLLAEHSDLKIYIVSTDVDQADAIKALKSLRVLEASTGLIWAWDPESKWSEGLGTFQFPETYWVDLENRKIKKWVGLQSWDGVAGFELKQALKLFKLPPKGA